jgi:hypothetical protein
MYGYKCIQGFGWGNQRERDHLEGSGLDGRIKLRWIFRKWYEGVWTGSIWLRVGTGVGESICECDNGPSGSIKCGELWPS